MPINVLNILNTGTHLSTRKGWKGC